MGNISVIDCVGLIWGLYFSGR